MKCDYNQPNKNAAENIGGNGSPYFEYGIMEPGAVGNIIRHSKRMKRETRFIMFVIHGLMWEAREELANGTATPFSIIMQNMKSLIKDFGYIQHITETDEKYSIVNRLNFKGVRCGKVKKETLHLRFLSCYCKLNQRHGINAHCGNRRIRNRGITREWVKAWKEANL